MRLTKVIAGISDARNLLSQWLTSIKNGQQIRCAIDQLLTPVDIQYVIKAIIFVIETRRSGVLHVSGSEAVTYYELFQKLLQYVPEQERRRTFVQECTLREIQSHELLPQNCTLSNAKFIALSGITPRPLQEVCAELCGNFYGFHEFADRE